MLDVSRLRDLAMSESGFVFNPLTGHTYNLNGTAVAILQALKNGASPDDLPARLRDAFETEPEDNPARDVAEFVSRLREQGLVR